MLSASKTMHAASFGLFNLTLAIFSHTICHIKFLVNTQSELTILWVINQQIYVYHLSVEVSLTLTCGLKGKTYLSDCSCVWNWMQWCKGDISKYKVVCLLITNSPTVQLKYACFKSLMGTSSTMDPPLNQ